MEKRNDDRIGSAGIDQRSVEDGKRLPGKSLRKLVSFGVAAALAAGTLAGCAGENEAKATPDTTQQQVEETIKAEEVTSTPEESIDEATSMPEVITDDEGTLEYTVNFPNPVVDESILEGIDETAYFYDRMSKMEPFYAANGIFPLTDEDIKGEGYAQRILDNFQQRVNLVNDTIFAGYGSFAATVAENSLANDELANYLSLPDEHTTGFFDSRFLADSFDLRALEHNGEGEVLSPTFVFGEVSAYTGPPADNFVGGLWLESKNGEFSGEPANFQGWFVLVWRSSTLEEGDGLGGWWPVYVGSVVNPGENGAPQLSPEIAGVPSMEIFRVGE